MKKLLVLVLSLAMVLSLSACGNKETKKQTIVEMDIPAKPCTPVMEIWMWQSQGIVMVIMNLS